MPFENTDIFNDLDDMPSDEESEYAEDSSELEDGVTDADDEQTSEDEEYSADEESETEEQEEEEQEEKLYAGRFKSVDDLEKSYKALQSQLTPILQELRTKQTAESFQLPQQQPTIPNELANNPQFQQIAATNPAMAAQVVANYTRNMAQQQITQNVQPMQRELTNMKLEMEIDRLKATTPDFDAVAPDLPVVFNENPWLWQSPNPVTTAYKLLKADRLGDTVSQATKLGKAAAIEKRKQKKSAGAERQKGKQAAKKATPEDDIVSGILGAKASKNAFL